MADVYETIANAADKYGVPVEALLAIAKIESNFQAGADNPNSSASGLFQFTDGTAGGLGLTGSKRNDIEAQAEAAAKMAASNSRSLASALGRPPTAGELYLAHQQGLSGAKALLANPNLPASEVLARFHGNNASKVITQNGGNLNMTAGEFASQWVNKGNKTAGLFPPGEIPRVGSVLSTAPTPRLPPAPVTPSIDMAQMRRISAPSQLIPDTFAGLSKGKRYLSDELGMSPVGGGKQNAPMFDAAYDERLGAMQLTQQPINSQGMATGSSKAPPPVPKVMSPQIAVQRAKDPVLQAALNAKYAPSASDLVRGNPMQTKEVATTIASYPTTTKPKVSASDLARGKSGISTVATIPTTGYPTTAQIVGATGFRPPPAIPDRLPQGVAGLPALYGTGNVAGVGTKAIAPMPFSRPPGFPAPTQMAQGKVAPTPFNRPTAVGTQLSTTPMPPLPIPRPLNGLPQTAPSGTIKQGADGKTYQFGSNGQWMTTTMTPTPMGMGGGEMPAPIPATMSPFLAFRRSLPTMPTLRPPTSPAAQKVWMTGFSDSGSSGGAHGGSESDKHRGEAVPVNTRSYK